MRNPSFHDELLPSMAKLSFRLAQDHCADCRDYHATWPYRRMFGAVGGIEADRPQLMPLLKEVSSDTSCRRWLIPGSADSGILATVAASIAAPERAEFIVVDRCPTPLAVCRAYAEASGLALETHAIDLAALSLDRPIDAIVAQSVMGFIATGDQPGILACLKNSLRPNGHFILCTRYRSGRSDEDLAMREARILGAFRAALAAGTIELPEAQSDFEARLLRDARRITSRNNLPDTPEAEAANLREAGFAIEGIIRSELPESGSKWTSAQARHRSIIHARS